MSKKRIVFVKSYYPVHKDPRLIKLFKMLENSDYLITYLGWNRSSISLTPMDNFNCHIRHDVVLQMKASLGVRSLVVLPLWWLFELYWLLKLQWDIAHVINFSSIVPAIIASKLKNKPIIYDVEDTYVDQLNLHRKNILRVLGLNIERLCMKYVNAVILVDDIQVKEFGSIPNTNLAVIYDSPTPLISHLESCEEKEFFTIFYAGYLDKSRNLNLHTIIEAINSLDGTKLILAGEGDLINEIKMRKLISQDKIHYIGWIAYDTVLKLSTKSDLLFSLRDPTPLVQKYICGSKFLESTMCGKPILVNKGTSAAIKVIQNKCGIVVDAHNVDEVKEAILRLKNDKNLYKKLELNSKKAYEKNYSWNIMKNRLLTLYIKLLKIN